KRPAGIALVRKLIAQSDVLIENFRHGAMDELGLGSDAALKINPRLVYCALKGFLPGPYEKRVALDEVVQMMGGMAYMTGPPGQPLRAGASVNDVLGGVFGALAILAALRERDRTGRGGAVQSGLFETNMFLMAQHMAYSAIEGRELPSFADPTLGRPWPVYDVLDCADGGAKLFVGVVTLTQWRKFCEAFGLHDLLHDPELATMQQLAAARARILPKVAAVFQKLPQAELMHRCEALGLPFAPIARPAQMFEDPHLLASGGLLPIDFARAQNVTGTAARAVAGVPGLPVLMRDGRPCLRRQPPRIGEHSVEVAVECDVSTDEIDAMLADGTLFASP
ncbi:CaiB/BaiF CoA transferase family protein, partial [Steroidobacter sp.]|uniref:CaiB/BaiF CoA transferase family protein n=1 Tax=Steroidobacter sp. TaxID=1978227 RepID=UPI001A5C0329